jgi:hypothetical protein
MANAFSERYGDLLTGSYDCVDRIVLNAYYPLGPNPGGFQVWWRRWHQDSDEQLDNAHVMRLAGRFARRVRAWAAAHRVPVIDCKAGERKHHRCQERPSRQSRHRDHRAEGRRARLRRLGGPPGQRLHLLGGRLPRRPPLRQRDRRASLVPGVQVGVKVPVAEDGTVGRIHAAVRPLMPGQGCLWCNQLINPTELPLEMSPDSVREGARYVDDVPAPSVIALNAIPVADAVNQFMMGTTGLLDDDRSTVPYVITFPRDGTVELHTPRRDSACPRCGDPS